MESQEFLLLVDDMLKYQDAGTTVADLRRVIRRMLEEESPYSQILETIARDWR